MDYLSKKADSGEVVDLQELFYKYTLGMALSLSLFSAYAHYKNSYPNKGSTTSHYLTPLAYFSGWIFI